jgi:hypothetical protein
MEKINEEYDSVVPIWGDQCGVRRTRKYNTSPPQRNLLFTVQKLVCLDFITLETERCRSPAPKNCHYIEKQNAFECLSIS